jgi:L,D-transpeptidase ErfK/SrfK
MEEDPNHLLRLARKSVLIWFKSVLIWFKSFLCRKRVRLSLRIIAIFFLTCIFLFIIVILPPLLQHRVKSTLKREYLVNSSIADSVKMRRKIETDIQKLDKQITTLIPRSNYLIINSALNNFYLYKGRNQIYSGRCSTGSYILLQNGPEQEWLFKTPKGEFRVQHKKKYPVWKKPDWAFIEEGKPVPSPNHASRFEYGVLGDYSLSIGDGYMIHGTLYQRYLGLPVTHGCVRLNDADLEKVYHSLSEGSRVYIY